MFPRRPTVNKNLWLMPGVFAALLAVNLSLGGCTSGGSQKPPRLQEKIEDARTRADHEELAAYYEQEARSAQAKAQLHLDQAESYRRGAPFVYPRLTAPFLADHCVSIANKYKRVADENLKLAKSYRDLAAGEPE